MTEMKLRNFLYINKKLIDDYISAIDGYVYEEETQKLNSINQKAANANANLLGISGNGKYEKQSSEEVERTVRISDAAKFDKLFTYLSADEYSPLRYYEILSDEEFFNLGRDEFIEVLVTPRFSKINELSDAAKKLLL